MDQYLIVDIGTSSLRVVVLDDGLNALDSRVVKRSAPTCFDAEAEWGKICEMTRSLTGAHRRLRAIAVSSLLGWVAVDSEGRAVTPCYSYMHQAAEPFRRFRETYADEAIYEICRRRITPEMPAFQLQHLRDQEPDLYAAIDRLLSLKDFINLKLTGQAAMDHTTAGYTMMYDIAHKTWSDRSLEMLQLDDRRLPKLLHPWEALGTLRPELAEDLGLEAACPVTVGSVDGSTGIFGAGGCASGTMVSVMGTTDTCFTVMDRIIPDASGSLAVNPHVLPGLWLAGGPMGMYGGTLEWLLNNVMNGSKSMKEMDLLAAEVAPGCGGVQMIPTLAGERAPFWLPEMRGTVIGLAHEHHAGHIFRAIMEANGYALRKMAELLQAGGADIQQVLATGGGSSSDLWLQIKADILNIPIFRANVKEATVDGSCMLAMLATGTPVGALPISSAGRVFEPNPDAVQAYNQLYSRYLDVHGQSIQIYRG